MTNGFYIGERLPSLNDYILACRSDKYKGAQFKSDVENRIMFWITKAKQAGTLRVPAFPIGVVFEWHEKTRRRDADNIAGAKKFILDAMQRAGILPNDSRKYVDNFTDLIVDDGQDYVQVYLQEVAKT